MPEKLKQIIKDGVVNLPKESQDAINAFDWGKVSEEIGKKYLLDENEINNLQIEIGLVLIGLAEIDLFVKNIEENVDISKEETEKISEEINQKIFNPIYETISKTIENNIKTKNPDWKKVLNFILSGGNYFVFLERNNNVDDSKPLKTITLNNGSKFEDIKNKFVI